MKRIVCLCIMAALCLCFLLPEKAQAVSVNGTCGDDVYWAFDVDSGTLTIFGTGAMTNFQEINPKPQWRGLDIVRVIVEDGVTSVGDYAFYNYSSGEYNELEEVYIADSVTYIGESAFEQCINLSKVVLPKGLQTIRASAFEMCYRLKNITIPEGVKEIPYNCFRSSGLEYVHLPESLETIIIYAFFNTSLKQVTIPNKVNYIGNYAFAGTSIKSIVIPDSVTRVGAFAFYDCTDLSAVKLSQNLKVVEDSVFMYSGVKDLYIPDGVEEIDPRAFQSFYVNRVSLPASLKNIEENAFLGDQAFQYVAFRGDAPSFSDNALYGSVLRVYYPESNKTWTENVMQDYGGTAVWQAWNCEEEHCAMKLPSIEATCTQSGLTEGSICAICGTILEPQEIVEATGHTPAEDYGFAATCTLNGVTDGTHCEKCFKELTPQKIVRYAGHKIDKWTVVREATIYETGTMEGKCTVCGKTEEKVIPVLTSPETTPTDPIATEPPEETIPGNTEHQHTFGEWEIVDSSEEGVLVERSCETCGHTEQKPLDESYPPQTDPSDAPTNPEDTPAEPTDTPTEPTQTSTDAPTEPTQPDITVKEESKTFPWVIIVIAVAAIGAAAGGVILGKKRK